MEMLCGCGKDEYWPKQDGIVRSWLKLAMESFRKPEDYLPGQLFAFVSPRDYGKSLWQAVVTAMFDGRRGDPGLWFTGRTDSNYAMWAGESVALSDANLPNQADGAKAFTEKLKEVIANDVDPYHRKRECREAVKVYHQSAVQNVPPEARLCPMRGYGQ